MDGVRVGNGSGAEGQQNKEDVLFVEMLEMLSLGEAMTLVGSPSKVNDTMHHG